MCAPSLQPTSLILSTKESIGELQAAIHLIQSRYTRFINFWNVLLNSSFSRCCSIMMDGAVKESRKESDLLRTVEQREAEGKARNKQVSN